MSLSDSLAVGHCPYYSGSQTVVSGAWGVLRPLLGFCEVTTYFHTHTEAVFVPSLFLSQNCVVVWLRAVGWRHPLTDSSLSVHS